ncbi:hypothetical protein WCP94_004005 [Bilophila wadsworthia]
MRISAENVFRLRASFPRPEKTALPESSSDSAACIQGRRHTETPLPKEQLARHTASWSVLP